MFKSGKLTNAKKTLHPGKGVLGLAIGSHEFNEWLNDNPGYVGYPLSYVNDPYVISQNDDMVSINACIGADLYGQISSESSGTISPAKVEHTADGNRMSGNTIP